MRSSKAVSFAAAIAAACLSVAVAGAEVKNTPTDAIRNALRTRFPDMPVVSVQPAPVAGLYEVYTGNELVYTDAGAEHLIIGPLWETASKRNLTAERIGELTAIDFSTLPLDRAIRTVKGNGSRKLAVFSDPDCPFCKKLEQELASVTDVTIYTFLYPIAALHPAAASKARAIWCSENRPVAWKQWMIDGQLPEERECKDAASIDENVKLGEQLGINGTPTLFGADGRRVSGTLSAEALEGMLSAAAR